VLAAAIGCAFATAGYRRLLAASIDTRPLADNLLVQIDAVWYLVAHPLLSLRTNIDPELPSRIALAPDLVVQGALLAAVAASGVWQLRRRPWVALGILWFFLHLLPTNSILPRSDPANDRHLYLAMIGPAILIATVLQNVKGRRAASAAAFALALLLGAATVQRNRDYRSEVALWQATAAASPDKARVWNNLGYAQALAGNRPAARSAYERALALDPAHVKARYNLEALHPGE
jgi:tetratricopeptide (TPR) repeat protein